MRVLPPCERPARAYCVPRPLASFAALLLACGEQPKALAPEPQLAALSASEAELYAYRTLELEQMFDDAARAKPTDPLQTARALTRLTRVHARIDGRCGLCERATPVLSAAIAREPKGEACAAGLDFLRVLVRDSTDTQAAADFGQALLQRFAAPPETADCASAVRALHAEVSARQNKPPHTSTSETVVEPPRLSDVAISGREVARFAVQRDAHTAASVKLQSIEHFGGGGESEREVRVVLGFDGPAQFHRGELPARSGAARRIVLDFDHTQRAQSLTERYAIGAGGVTNAVTSEPDASTTRIEFEVADTTQYRLFFLPGPYRVVIDFSKRDATAPPAASIRTIVLDPGHGGAQSGARGPNGLSEADVALSLALRVRRVLGRTLPDPRVVLTREQDRIVSLEERTAIANALGADLFVSIHLNASPSAADRGGVSTYVLDATHDAQALGLAARENDALADDVSALSPLFSSLVRRDQVARSLELAQVVQQATLKNGRRQLPKLEDRGVKRALFYVLVGARMPAILCETSFLSRPDEAAALRTDTYRQLLAEGIAEGIARYVRKVEKARTVLAEQPDEARR